jgi:hypothetical protein
MSKYRYDLPQLQDRLFMTDGGLETTLVFHKGIDLPHFAAFDLLKDDEGTEVLHRELARYAEVARAHSMGVVLESPTWRANPDWAAKIATMPPGWRMRIARRSTCCWPFAPNMKLRKPRSWSAAISAREATATGPRCA